ncbi:hypothetical protein ABIB25_001313 [Nakamurella sp. UYEF19]|uniref:hypothetical protein n=1 Tax=Nakamurella sp. UYEF19 TaxID=1756392 RepID=UPI0033974092
MSQPPAGGYPPPDSNQPGGYPPPAPGYQPPPAPGYQPPPAPGYQPPPAYTPTPAPGGYQPPPAPGYAPPPAGGYAPPPGGYPPPAAGYQPPAPAYGGPPAPAGGGMPSVDISKVTVIGWGVIGAAFLTLIASFFNFWSVSFSGQLSAYASSSGLSGWTSWWWLPVLLALAVGVVYALTLFGIIKPGPIKPEFLFYGALGSFVLMVIVLILTFSYGGSYYSSDLGGVSAGPGFGVWFAVVTTLALAYFTALSVQSKGGKLPFKVPGPAL